MVAGHGRIEHEHLDDAGRLVELAGAAPAEWGLLFVLDARGRRWTLYSPDPDYTAMYAPAAEDVVLDFGVFTAKFPGWNRGWTIT